MLKNYKDLLFAYFFSAFTGGVALTSVFTAFELQLIGGMLAILWVLGCIIFLNKIAIKRFKNIVSFAENCELEKTLNHFYSFYKGNTKSKKDLFWALQISNCLLHLGKNDLVLNMLLQYNPEALMKRKIEVVYKYAYYNTLSVCYSRLGRKEEAIEAYKKSDVLFNSPFFNKKLKPIYEIMHKVNYLIIIDGGTNCEEILCLLNGDLNKCESLLSQVSCRFSIVRILAKKDRLEEASEHIAFIRENGGDTVYAKCILNDDYSNDFINKVSREEWKPNPTKLKHYKGFVVSGMVVGCVVALTTLTGFLTTKTVYIHDYNGTGTEYIRRFDKSGESLSWEMKSSGTYLSEEDAQSQYDFCSYYLFLNSYKGCKVTLKKTGKYIYFHLFVDFDKTNDEIFNLLDFSKDEKDYVEFVKNGEYTISKYKEFLGIMKFEKFIKPGNN